ncbi:hypothetical protein Gotur_025378, partial [Gossypium turneri]
AYKIDLPGEYNVSSTFNVANLSPFDFSDSRTNLFEEGGNDMSHKGPTQTQERDGLKLPQGPITRSKARQIRVKLNGTIHDFISKALEAYTKEKENQDSLSCFQENQETESWSNFAVLSDFKNQENQDFKSWKSWSKKLNLAAKAHWIAVTSINRPILGENRLQAQ